jgi:plastocyanin
MDRQRPIVAIAAAVSLVVAAFALAMALTTTDRGTASPPADPAIASSPVGTDDGAAATFAITIVDFTFTPADAVVPAGTTIVFTNEDSFAHSVVPDGEAFSPSPTLEHGDSYRVTLDEPGTYPYSCGIHPRMTGTITVQG